MRSHRYAVSGTRPRGGRPSARLGRSVLDARSPFYRFETFDVEDGHGGRWRMRIGIPRTRPPRRGFPALWMLDGNRALAQFDHTWLQGLAAAPTPWVLVFVGPDNDLLVDLPRRAHDYTFQPADHPFLAAPTAPPGPVGGGADALLEVLAGQAMPALTRRVPLDRERQALWGHSLAGLFVLHALYSGRRPFAEYAAASPSLWWSQGALLGDPEQRFSREGAGARHAPVAVSRRCRTGRVHRSACPAGSTPCRLVGGHCRRARRCRRTPGRAPGNGAAVGGALPGISRIAACGSVPRRTAGRAATTCGPAGAWPPAAPVLNRAGRHGLRGGHAGRACPAILAINRSLRVLPPAPCQPGAKPSQTRPDGACCAVDRDL